ncbi:MAG: response regulator [Candidatus Krumholzibacteria bacterium]|nr:response regulator [Candidatus Krumholzibacteria bacterium]
MTEKGRVLVIDDEADVLDILREFIAGRGYRVDTADSCEAARELAGRERYEIVLADRELPDGSGLDLIEEFQSSTPDVRSIVMTERSSMESTIAAMRPDVFDQIQKPFDLVKIGEMVDAAHDHIKMSRQDASVIERLESAYRRLEKDRAELDRKVIETNEELARVNDSLKRHVTRLKMLFQMGRDISSNENWSDALDRFLMALCRYLEAEGAALLLYSGGGAVLQIRTSYNMEIRFLETAVRLILDAQKRDTVPTEIFNLDSCHTPDIETCLAAMKPWNDSAIPLLYKGRWLGFLVIRKRYASKREYLGDYHFITTIQTILTEEVANAANISRLRNLKDFNETILESMHSGVLRTDREGRVIFANRRARELLGDVASGAVHIGDLFANTAGSGEFFDFLRGGAGGTMSIEADCTVPGGRTIPVSVNSTVVESDEFTGISLVIVFEDLTARKELEEELRRSDRLRSLGELSAGVAHEIRNPLTGIATTAQVLREKLGEDPERLKYIDVILEEIRRLDDIIRSMLHFGRPAAPRPMEVSMCDIVEEALMLVADSAAEAGVSLRFVSEVDRDMCLLDRDQIKQVVLNLAMNGVQACRSGGEVRVILRPGTDPALVRLDFEDSGCGIPAGASDRLYNPFFTTRSNGTGLGLSISRSIVEAHGGRISHESVEGRGATFHVDLPRLTVAVSAPEESRQAH